MNILPKKNWHVRTKENIARVRRDEAKAAEEEKEMERRRKLAEQEARTQLLRSRARLRLGHDDPGGGDQKGVEGGEAGDEKKELGYDTSVGEVESLTNSAGHVNFFQNLEQGEKLKEGNEENAAEKKREQEEYEKKVGYLTYLGQDTEELTGEKPWWRKLPQRQDLDNEQGTKDVGSKQKNFLDPLENLKKKLGCESDTLSLKKHESKDSKNNIKALTHDNSARDKKLKRKRSASSSSSDSDHRKKKRRKSEKKKKRRKTSSDSEDSSSSSGSRRKKKRKSEKSKKKESKSKKKKSRKRKKKHFVSTDESSSESDTQQKKKEAKSNLERLRRERLERERKERERTNKLLFGDKHKDKKDDDEVAKPPELKQAYNSQFNPEVARQNKLDPNKKYWLE